MRTVELGTTGAQVSALGLGALPMGTRADEDSSFALLDRFVADGGTLIDTADVYSAFTAQGTTGGQSESVLGRWFAARGTREQVFLSTKGAAGWTDPDRVWPPGQAEPDWEVAYSQFTGAGAASLRDSLAGSLQRLGTDYVDLYYIHVDDRNTPLEETLETLASFVADGSIRHYGYSNVRAWRLEAIVQLCDRYGWPTPVAVQQEFTYLQRRPGLRWNSIVDDDMLDFLRTRPDITLVAYSPLRGGLYDIPPSQRAEDWTYQHCYSGEHSERRLATVDAIAAELGATPGQVVLAWILAQDDPRTIPLLGTSRVDRYVEQSGALDLRLGSEHLTRLNEA